MPLKQTTGSRAQVMHGTAKKTTGGLTKSQLKYNKQGKIVSKKASALAKKNNRLVKAGFVTRKGVFGVSMRGGMVHNKYTSSNALLYDPLTPLSLNSRIYNGVSGSKVFNGQYDGNNCIIKFNATDSEISIFKNESIYHILPIIYNILTDKDNILSLLSSAELSQELLPELSSAELSQELPPELSSTLPRNIIVMEKLTIQRWYNDTSNSLEVGDRFFE